MRCIYVHKYVWKQVMFIFVSWNDSRAGSMKCIPSPDVRQMITILNDHSTTVIVCRTKLAFFTIPFSRRVRHMICFAFCALTTSLNLQMFTWSRHYAVWSVPLIKKSRYARRTSPVAQRLTATATKRINKYFQLNRSFNDNKICQSACVPVVTVL